MATPSKITNKLAKKTDLNLDQRFSTIIRNEIVRKGNKWQSGPAPLAAINYTEEIKLKTEALLKFFPELPHAEPSLLPSPQEFKYRTTSKRRVHFHLRKGLAFSFSSTVEGRQCQTSDLEPDSHTKCYLDLYKKLQHPKNLALTKTLSWIIIRSSGTDFSIIFNVTRMHREIVQVARFLYQALGKENKNLKAIALYHDETGSEYYLENKIPAKRNPFKIIGGDPFLSLCHTPLPLRFPLTSFSQINETFHASFLEIVEAFLKPEPHQTLLDLFCGYGFFSLHLAHKYKNTTGIEFKGESINQAQKSAQFLNLPTTHFKAAFIDAEWILNLAPAKNEEVFLLDPPRQGVSEALIKAIAERAPKKVLHIFCGVDRIKPELEIWNRAGYQVKRSQFLDLFPRTDSVEALILLEKSG